MKSPNEERPPTNHNDVSLIHVPQARGLELEFEVLFYFLIIGNLREALLMQI